MVDYARHEYGLSLRAACRTLQLSRTVYRYQPDATRDDPVIVALQELAEKYPTMVLVKCFPFSAGMERNGIISEFTEFTVT